MLEFLGSTVGKYGTIGLLVIAGLYISYRLIKRAGRKQGEAKVRQEMTQDALESAQKRLEINAETESKTPTEIEHDLGLTGPGGLRRPPPS